MSEQQQASQQDIKGVIDMQGGSSRAIDSGHKKLQNHDGMGFYLVFASSGFVDLQKCDKS